MRIIVGLGNPGPEYADTRHNAGWMALEEVASLCKAAGEEFRGDGVSVQCGQLLLFKPLLYMNRCGPPVARLLRQTGVPLADLLVLVDDVNLPLGAVRLRAGGSTGGHNGLSSLVEALETTEFARLRMGVGAAPPGMDMRDYVLSPFDDAEWDEVDRMVERAADAVLCWHREGVEAAMSRYNRREEDPQSP